MTLRIDEAAKKALELRHRLANGEAAIKALEWLSHPDILTHAKLKITSSWGSVHDGNKAALEYINEELARIEPDIIARAKRQAQQDMDGYLGNQMDHC
ncbi:MAG: hypothetical protein H2050_15610 [Sphingobium sp.]|uniref:hypothetical protein n=1 Tax=Sphingobium sp. TaxID=1912891 RepID=UPI0018104F48|nr:hypothetical protein [Sphingobium sp.]MBA4756252.1 hypothetical protein [Sphingobium sp.]